MADNKGTAIATLGARDPFSLLRQMTAEFDRAFDEPFFGFRWPAVRTAELGGTTWAPRVDVFEREGRLVTKVDLPGMKKEDVTVQVTDGYLALSGERKQETEETKDNVYRSERQYGSFCRTVPLPSQLGTRCGKWRFRSRPRPARPRRSSKWRQSHVTSMRRHVTQQGGHT